MPQIWYQGSLGLAPSAIIGLGLLVGVLFLAILILKGYSLWYAAKRNEKAWFIILLIVNTLGILELIYIIFVVKGHKKPEAINSNPSNGPTSTTV